MLTELVEYIFIVAIFLHVLLSKSTDASVWLPSFPLLNGVSLCDCTTCSYLIVLLWTFGSSSFGVIVNPVAMSIPECVPFLNVSFGTHKCPPLRSQGMYVCNSSNPSTSFHHFLLFLNFETGCHYGTQAGPKLAIIPPLPPTCWDARHVPPGPIQYLTFENGSCANTHSFPLCQRVLNSLSSHQHLVFSEFLFWLFWWVWYFWVLFIVPSHFYLTVSHIL
jgi:hypothetical protein